MLPRMQVSTISRAALLLSINPLVRSGTPSLSATRLHNILFPQCAIRTMSDSKASTPPNPAQTNTQPETKPHLYLPESDGTAAQVQGSGIKLDMSGGGTEVKLDHLGPMVVNVDGTLSQIGNWQQMTDVEKQNTLRILGKRNQKRLEALRAKESEQ